MKGTSKALGSDLDSVGGRESHRSTKKGLTTNRSCYPDPITETRSLDFMVFHLINSREFYAIYEYLICSAEH